MRKFNMTEIIRDMLFTIIIFGAVCSCFAGDKLQDPCEKITVLKKGAAVYIRSYFSTDKNVLISVGKGANGQINFANTRLIPSSVPMDESAFAGGLVFHQCPDDSTPWALNGTAIGANHGCSDGREIVAPKHGLTVADIGSEWTDESSEKFYIVKIPNPDTVWILSENKSGDEMWKFNTTVKGPVLKNKDGSKTLDARNVKMVQLIPACRIKKQNYLVNGKTPLEEGVSVSCDWLDIEEDYDIIATDSLLTAIRNNPGKETKFNGEELDAVVNNCIIYRFLPMGACTIEHNSTAKRTFNLGSMCFIQSNPLNKDGFDSYLYYIPKTHQFELKGVKYDFKSIQDFSGPIPDYLYFGKDKIEGENNPPDRFIQLLGKTDDGRNVNKIGYVIGFSLLDGITRPEIRARQAGQWAYMGINPATHKSYPYAMMPSPKDSVILAGTTFHCLAYRQYFDPSVYKNATSVYWHKEGGSYILYIDYHKSVENDVIKLPDYLSGRKISVVEKTPSVKLLTGETVPADGIGLSVGDRYGYIILKLD